MEKIKIINLLITNPFILIEYTTDYQSYRLTTLKGYVQLHRPPSNLSGTGANRGTIAASTHL